MERIRVLLADDHTLFRKGIRSMLEEMPERLYTLDADPDVKDID